MIKKTIELETSRLLLRKITLDDAINMFNNWASDSEVTKYLNWKTHKSLNDTIRVITYWINKYHSEYFFQWVIEYKETREIIGTISLFDYRFDSLEIGFCISKKYWNLGLVTEATRRVLEFAFFDVGVKKVRAKHIRENIASGRVMIKNNMKYTKSTEEYIESKSKVFIMDNYFIVKENFK